ncbi:GvpL/GvpF family gas vesicle protein [Streptomyces sp. NPDC012888]|uniref:GvpL/GvpF family gas vesicle protein n=1 Tax=Streptomyces sp. NPDC012888 TaxID=3364855 RepID=UPI00368BA960
MTDIPLFYAYTVIEASAADALPDLPAPLGGGLRLVGDGRHAAVVEPVDPRHFDEEPLRAGLEDLDWLSAVARAHHGVVAAVGDVTTTVPLRLATVCRGEDGVRRMLSEAGERLAAAIDRLTGAQEWGVKLYARPDAPGPDAGGTAGGPEGTAPPDGPRGPDGTPRPEGTPRPDGADGTSGRGYLRRRLDDRRAREASRTLLARTAQDLHRELSRHAAAAVLHPPQDGRLSGADGGQDGRHGGRQILNAAYLVPVGGRQEFLDAVPAPGALGAGLHVEVTGPWVPYSFAAAHDDAGPAR